MPTETQNLAATYNYIGLGKNLQLEAKQFLKQRHSEETQSRRIRTLKGASMRAYVDSIHTHQYKHVRTHTHAPASTYPRTHIHTQTHILTYSHTCTLYGLIMTRLLFELSK